MALSSQAVVTHGNQRQVGLLCDRTSRIFYVDDIEVARYAQTSLAVLAGGLRVRAGANLAPGTYWSGQIDDRAVKP